MIKHTPLRLIVALGALVVGLSLGTSASDAAGPYTVPPVSRVTGTILTSGLGSDIHVVCLARMEEGGAASTFKLTPGCYNTHKPLPPPSSPPADLEPIYRWPSAAYLDEASGELTTGFFGCSEVAPGLLAIKLDMSVTLDKAGGPASGSMIFTADWTTPFDCEDGTESIGPATLTPLAQSHDEDQDGCSDWEELGDNQSFGGLRDPFNFWDFFDTPDEDNVRDKLIRIDDVIRVQNRYGADGDPTTDPLSPPPPAPAYHPAFDRGAVLGPDAWNLEPANGMIRIGDITAVLNQYGHGCADPP